jgi:hypothetical protein
VKPGEKLFVTNVRRWRHTGSWQIQQALASSPPVQKAPAFVLHPLDDTSTQGQPLPLVCGQVVARRVTHLPANAAPQDGASST